MVERMRRATWLDMVAAADGEREPQSLTPQLRQALARLDESLFAIWNLGENVLLAWTRGNGGMQVLAVRHYEIAEASERSPSGPEAANSAADLINGIMAGPKFLP